jgi:hypothetical protein
MLRQLHVKVSLLHDDSAGIDIQRESSYCLAISRFWSGRCAQLGSLRIAVLQAAWAGLVFETHEGSNYNPLTTLE